MRCLRTTLVLLVFLVAACSDAGDNGTPQAGEDTAVDATSEATSPTDGATTSPVPTVGSSAPLAPRAVAEADGIRVTLLQLVDPWQTPPGEERPGDGMRYVEIAVTVENYSGRSLHLGYDDFTFESDAESAVGIDIGGATPYLESQTLAADATVQGFVVAELPDDAQLTVIRFDADVSTPDEIVFGQ
jgi:hypothetical protein